MGRLEKMVSDLQRMSEMPMPASPARKLSAGSTTVSASPLHPMISPRKRLRATSENGLKFWDAKWNMMLQEKFPMALSPNEIRIVQEEANAIRSNTRRVHKEIPYLAQQIDPHRLLSRVCEMCGIILSSQVLQSLPTTFDALASDFEFVGPDIERVTSTVFLFSFFLEFSLV